MRDYGRVVTVTPPAALMSVETAKAWLRFSGTSDDAVIEMLLAAVTEEVEQQILHQYLMPRTVDVYFDGWPDGHVLPLPATLRAVTSLTYYDSSGQAHTLPADGYVVSTPGLQPTVVATAWPGTQLRTVDGVVVRCEVGHAADAVPMRYQLLILALVAVDFANRDALAADAARQRENVLLRLLGERASG